MAMYPNDAMNPHPLCPTCQSAEDVSRKTRLEMDEFHWLDADGFVISSADGDERYETGYAWYCMTCGNEWAHEGSLASDAPTPSYAAHAVYLAELRAAEAFSLELRKTQPLWVDSARQHLSQHEPHWTAVELAALLRQGLAQLPAAMVEPEAAKRSALGLWVAWPLPDWSKR